MEVVGCLCKCYSAHWFWDAANRRQPPSAAVPPPHPQAALPYFVPLLEPYLSEQSGAAALQAEADNMAAAAAAEPGGGGAGGGGFGEGAKSGVAAARASRAAKAAKVRLGFVHARMVGKAVHNARNHGGGQLPVLGGPGGSGPCGVCVCVSDHPDSPGRAASAGNSNRRWVCLRAA